MTHDAQTLETLDQVRGVIGEPHRAVMVKVADSLDPRSIDFIGRAPFLVLATADRSGATGVSPKGDL